MSRDSDKKKNNKKHREEIRNISSIENGTSRAYRQKVLVRQAGKLVDELERARREEQETQADGIIRQKVVKRKSTRIAYRVVGIIFVLAGIAVVWWAMGGHYRMIKAAIAIAAMAYGFYVVKASFRKSAYDMTYLFRLFLFFSRLIFTVSPDFAEILYAKRSARIVENLFL